MLISEKMNELKPREDAFGQILSLAYGGSEAFEIVERDDGYIEAMPAKAYFSEYTDWPQIEQKAMDFVRGRVLDVGCGAGRMALYLQSKGFNVTGIDISPLAVKICRLRGVRKAKLKPIEKVDFRPNAFDTIIMMGNNFGLFGNFNKARRLLKKFNRITSKNAIIVADTNDPYKTDNSAHLDYHKRNREKGRMGGQLRIRIRHKQYKGRWFEYLLASKQEIKEILKGTGWEVEQFMDSDGVRLSRYLAIIKKAN
jgi:SAM-dependent methyltransferase